ncbi:MAG: HzsA-related protein [Planctomycetota bacterium]|jgi:hypothetical protein
MKILFPSISPTSRAFMGIVLCLAAGVAAEPAPPEGSELQPTAQQAMIERDWRMQDGIGTQRAAATWTQAILRTIETGKKLVAELERVEVDMGAARKAWEQECANWETVRKLDEAGHQARFEALWLALHSARRRLSFSNPLARTGPILFVKRVPSGFSHQLTQYQGMHARPGGGLFVLEEPGTSMRCRQLAASLPDGSCLRPDVSYDGQSIFFAFCEINRASGNAPTYQVCTIQADGTKLRALTRGPHDNFSPCCLPDGKILFLSTRRGGYHRCGRGPCPVYTMAVMSAEGSDPRVVSFHETHEWDPSVLNDGRVVYTRWDYVDRHAVHYQQLWTVRPDGSDVRIFYGNNTFNPVGVWEARAVPGSTLVMATAGAHHAMTAGSIILVDVAKGIDGLEPLTRLTPDVLFPESEAPVGRWHAPVGVRNPPPPVPVQQRRWPGHCHRSPYPLCEKLFLCAYSFDPLIGEPHANKSNMFGLYLVDAFGNKELLYRDPDIGSLWPIPLRARPAPPVVASNLDDVKKNEGTFFVRNVYESRYPLHLGKGEAIHRLRVLQVLLKTTPHVNQPRVGAANASPGKQVLGTVPVESDGSAYFRAPAGVPLLFQILDEQGRAVQTMRSLTYLQKGENVSCIGCHEDPSRAPDPTPRAQALARSPSEITPGPDGSRPLSYPLLVQPVLDRHCIRCHKGRKPPKGVVLTGEPAGAFTRSYNVLVKRVPYSEWRGGDFRKANSEPATKPGFFGARASKLLTKLLKGHSKVRLSVDEQERLVTWMDSNALFYGTFNSEDQRRQQLGERIPMSTLLPR